jgi:hypothetical protein
VLNRVVEYGDGWMPTMATASVDSIRAGRSEINRLAAEAGRDPAGIEITAFHHPADRGLVAAMADAGADRVILELKTAGEKEALAQLEDHAKAVF